MPAEQFIEETQNGRRQGTKRKKYAARACHQCKKRKVKCSGEDDCEQCRSRRVECYYSPLPPPRILQTTSCQPTDEGFAPEQIPKEIQESQEIVHPDNSGFSQLCDRVIALERSLAHLLESTKKVEDPSPEIYRIPLQPLATNYDEQSVNQFTERGALHQNITVAAQVASMSALLSRPSSPKPVYHKPNKRTEIIIKMPAENSLLHLLNVYFRDFDAYYPFLDRQDTESHIYQTIRQLGYSSYNQVLVVTPEHFSTIALTCMMLGLCECMGPDEGIYDGQLRPGWEMYLKACLAIQHLLCSKFVDLNTVRAQCLVAAYLMQREVLGAASQAISLAWQMAATIHLNDKKSWPNSPKESLQRQLLWWTIYLLDRHISRRSGLPFHIRDIEYDVDDFSSHGTLAEYTEQTYLQAMISISRLWGHIWDTFFAVGAKNKGDWMEVEIMDARILNADRQKPAVLAWDSDQLSKYLSSGEDEPHIRRRLSLYSASIIQVLGLFRMLIRQNPVRQAGFNPETAHFCAQLSRAIINAHDLFFLYYPDTRATASVATTTMVECMYQLVPVMYHSKDEVEQTCSVSAFQQAHKILVKISAYDRVAEKAIKALEGLIRRWHVGASVKKGTDGRTDIHHDETADLNLTSGGLQIHDPQGLNLNLGAEGFGDLSGWTGISLDLSLFGN